MAPAAAPTPVPMRAPLPAPYPVPAPTAAPAPAPTAAPVTVPQAVTPTTSIEQPTTVAIVRFILMSLLLFLPLETERDGRGRRGGAHHRPARRARLPFADHVDVRPPVRRRPDGRRRLLPEVLIVRLGEHHDPAQAHAPRDRTDDLEHPDRLAPQVLKLRAPRRRGPEARRVREVTGLVLRVRRAELRRLRGGAKRPGRPDRQQLGERLPRLACRRLVQATSHVAVGRGRPARERGEDLDADRAVGALSDQPEAAGRGRVDEPG